jgi:hypothetical protein
LALASERIAESWWLIASRRERRSGRGKREWEWIAPGMGKENLSLKRGSLGRMA